MEPDEAWPTGLPATIAFVDRAPLAVDWEATRLMNRGGEAADALQSPPIEMWGGNASRPKSHFRWLLDPQNLDLVAIFIEETGEMWLEPLRPDPPLFVVDMVGTTFHILHEQPLDGVHTITVGGVPLEVERRGDTITYWLPFNEPPEVAAEQAWGVQMVATGGTVEVSETLRFLDPDEHGDWRPVFTLRDFQPWRPSPGLSFGSPEPIADRAQFDRVPPTSPDAPYPLAAALDRAQRDDAVLAQFMQQTPDWYAHYAFFFIASGLGTAVGTVPTSMHWRLELVGQERAVRTELTAPVVAGSAVLEMQTSETVEMEEWEVGNATRDEEVNADQVHALCVRRLQVYPAVHLEYRDVAGGSFSGPPPDSVWAPWYGCGLNLPGSKAILVDARTGLVESYYPSAVTLEDPALLPLPARSDVGRGFTSPRAR